jgi:hypothetical protein
MTCKNHEWVVFSTAVDDGCLMLQCVGCNAYATIRDPSKKEWSKAYHAHSTPYRWHDERRLVIEQENGGDLRYVQKMPSSAKKCDCYAELGVREPKDYERV